QRAPRRLHDRGRDRRGVRAILGGQGCRRLRLAPGGATLPGPHATSRDLLTELSVAPRAERALVPLTAPAHAVSGLPCAEALTFGGPLLTGWLNEEAGNLTGSMVLHYLNVEGAAMDQDPVPPVIRSLFEAMNTH